MAVSRLGRVMSPPASFLGVVQGFGVCFLPLAICCFFFYCIFRCRCSSGERHRRWWSSANQPGWNARGSPYFPGCHWWGGSKYDDRI